MSRTCLQKWPDGARCGSNSGYGLLTDFQRKEEVKQFDLGLFYMQNPLKTTVKMVNYLYLKLKLPICSSRWIDMNMQT